MAPYIITIVLALIGFITASAIRHSKKIGRPMVCPLDSDCDSVIHSSYSKFFGVDVTNFGLVYYGVTATLYALFAIFSSQIPDWLFVIGFLLTTFAVIFSFYLIIIQFLIIREWCFWCLVSAFISVGLLISSAFALGPNLHQFLYEYKNIIVVLHALSAALGVGTVMVTDIFFMKFLQDQKISPGESEILDTLSQVVWFALGMLILTGVALFLPSSIAHLAKTKFIAKVVIVGVIVVNGILLNLLIAPKLIKISFGGESTDHPNELRHLRKMAFAFGAVSIVSWIATFILGSVRSLSLSVGQILGIYLAIILVAIIGSQIFDRRVSKHKI